MYMNTCCDFAIMNNQPLSFGAFIRNATPHISILGPSADHMHTMPYEKALPNHVCMGHPRFRVFSHFSRTFAYFLADGVQDTSTFSAKTSEKDKLELYQNRVFLSLLNMYDFITDYFIIVIMKSKLGNAPNDPKVNLNT